MVIVGCPQHHPRGTHGLKFILQSPLSWVYNLHGNSDHTDLITGNQLSLSEEHGVFLSQDNSAILKKKIYPREDMYPRRVCVLRRRHVLKKSLVPREGYAPMRRCHTPVRGQTHSERIGSYSS